MPILALDTSSSVAVAVLADDGSVLASRSDSEQRHHAELLAPMVQHVLADAGVERTALTAVVAGTGPAPFTGLRVGLVTARTMALALDVPAWGVPSVDALAATAARTAVPGSHVLVVTDARRHEVYWAAYRVDGTGSAVLVAGPDIAAPAALVEHGRTAGAIVVGRGALLHREALGLPAAPTTRPPAAHGGAHLDPALHDADPALRDPDPAELGRLALLRHAAGQPLPTTPLYLRRPDAEPSAARKRVLT